MTPAQKTGIVEGERYRATRNCMFSAGSIVELYEDDESTSPLFRLIDGHTSINNADGEPGAYCNIENFEPVDGGEQMTQPQLMRQIADAMERDPEGWFREFEWVTPYNNIMTPSKHSDVLRL